MTSRREHYRIAEEILNAMSKQSNQYQAQAMYNIAVAQVHATLATVPYPIYNYVDEKQEEKR